MSLLDAAPLALVLAFSALIRRPATAEKKVETTAKEQEQEEADVGFTRAEMDSEKLDGTVKAHDKHFFFGLGADSHDSWPARVETTPLGQLLNAALKQAKEEGHSTRAKLTASDEALGTIRVFPDQLVYRLSPEQFTSELLSSIILHHLSDSPTETPAVASEPFQDPFVFVCSHTNRDTRCGVCGPALIQVIKEEVVKRSIAAHVHATSHVGGHKYAGNVIIFDKRPVEEHFVVGDWFGYITPERVPQLIQQYFVEHQVLLRQWRGSLSQVVHGCQDNGEHCCNGVCKDVPGW